MSKSKRKGIVTKTRFHYGEIKETVFAAIGIGVLLGGTFMITPNFPIVFASLMKLIEEFSKKPIPQRKIKRALKDLEKKEIISLYKKDSQVYVQIKDTNNISILKYSIKELLEIKKKKKWEGKWFLVVFDVPEKQRNKRDYLRRFLRDMGFYPYQQSVYVFPYECEKEIALVKKIIESAKYMSYVVAEKIEYEDKAKIFFGLS